MFVEINVHVPKEGMRDQALRALHDLARKTKWEQGIRQVAILEEDGRGLCFLAVWESRDAWQVSQRAKADADRNLDIAAIEDSSQTLLLDEV
jgi:heme-degrading monooxygenase HmoA